MALAAAPTASTWEDVQDDEAFAGDRAPSRPLRRSA